VNAKRKLERSDVEEEEEEEEEEERERCESDENHWKNTVSGGEGYERMRVCERGCN